MTSDFFPGDFVETFRKAHNATYHSSFGIHTLHLMDQPIIIELETDQLRWKHTITVKVLTEEGDVRKAFHAEIEPTQAPLYTLRHYLQHIEEEGYDIWVRRMLDTGLAAHSG